MTAHKITYSTELMDNYLHAQVMAAESGIQALAAADGHAVLFSISTGSAAAGSDLYATVEQSDSATGWARYNLCKGLGSVLPKTAACVDFSVCLDAGGKIDLAMVLRLDGQDHLYLSLDNPSDDLGWLENVAWTAVPYDDADRPRSALHIAGVLLSGSSDGEFFIVDVHRHGPDDDAAGDADHTSPIFRYYVDPQARNGKSWVPHDVAVDINSKAYSSVLGRKAGNKRFVVDGVYTAGQINGEPQLVYAPLFNVMDPAVPPEPSRLLLPEARIPHAIAVLRNADETTDLFVMSDDTLYHFDSGNQRDRSTGTRLVSNEVFHGTTELFTARTETDAVLVWGRNRSNQIFYCAVPGAEIAQPDSWSFPVPLMRDAEAVAPFYNQMRSANTFFAHAGENKLVKGSKCPETGLWSMSDITLPPPENTTPAKTFKSYTTHVEIRDATGGPLVRGTVSLAASRETAVLVNHIYYIIGPEPISVQTGWAGDLTIVEAVTSLAGSRLTVTSNKTRVVIDPMDKALDRATALDCREKLRKAEVQGLDGSSRPLIPEDASDTDLDAVAYTNRQIALTRADRGSGGAETGRGTESLRRMAVPQVTRAHCPGRLPAGVSQNTVFMAGTGGGSGDRNAPLAMARTMDDALRAETSLHGILVDIGDFFVFLGQKIAEGFRHVIRFIKDAAGAIWSVVVEIAGQIYHAILDTVEAIAEAAVWVYNAVKTAVKDLIDFLAFLFNPADLKRTKDAIKMFVQYQLLKQAHSLQDYQESFDYFIANLETQIASWAGLDHSRLAADDHMTTTLGANAGSGPPHSPAAQLLSHHFKNNADKVSDTAPADVAAGSPPDSLLEILSKAATSEKDAILTMVEQFGDLIKNAGTMPFADILKQILGILATFGLETVRTVGDAVFEVLSLAVMSALKALDTPIHIPVLSDILNAFGVEDFSLLDVVCWIAAVPTTLIYKGITGHAPFPTEDAVAPQPVNETARTATPGALVADAAPTPSALGGKPPLTLQELIGVVEKGLTRTKDDFKEFVVDVAEPFFREHAGIFLAVGNFGAASCVLITVATGPIEAMSSPDNSVGTVNTVLAIVGGALNFGGMLVGERYPLKDPNAIESKLGVPIKPSTGFTAMRLLLKVVLSSTIRGTVAEAAGNGAANLATQKVWRYTGAIIDAAMIIPAVSYTVVHLIDLAEEQAGFERSISIINETANITGCLGRISYAVAVSSEPPVNIGGAVALGLCNLAGCGLLIAEASVQTHHLIHAAQS